MEELILRETMFVNNKYLHAYGTNKTALFTIIDEEFQGLNHLGRINRITCVITTYGAEGRPERSTLSHLVIGIGDDVAGVTTGDASLLGKALTHENMDKCVVRLVE